MAETFKSPFFAELDARWGHIVEQTTLHGSWYRRALVLLAAADKCGGAETDDFRAWLAGTAESWHEADAAIIRRLSQVRVDQGNT